MPWPPVVLAVLAVASAAAANPRVGDITHLQGARSNKVMGLGLVVGLQGTGDGGKYGPTIRALAELQKKFANPVVSLDDLKDAKNVAIVQVEATLPENGAREGDRIDVAVSSLGPAKSLRGGRLMITPLLGPNPDDTRGVMALASGPLQLNTPELLTVAHISQGATLEQDWIHHYVALGRELPPAIRLKPAIQPDETYATLVITQGHDEWGVAHAIAFAINSASKVGSEDGPDDVALAVDPRTVVVRIPPVDRDNPARFLYDLENCPLVMPATEARVNINQATGTVIISGDVEISPTVISHKGLTITTTVPKAKPMPGQSQVVEQNFVALDPRNKGGASLQDLVDALNLLRVPPQDRITIIQKLHETGRLHATVIVDK
ncbi:MAG TPA: flagellar basal body P-ring protein FlgI [Phycisphaerae bacterium]|nr:flagellar basal body P-ring protein FlgI [Phycisphaerae bacterium]HRY68833.1 flagellar basal body P-ring protein FlgI [Phycisphaerae bacterium]HSA27498.1 flagellar basal body P-ring protein FlgI [Phycisphaerae bacterium]